MLLIDSSAVSYHAVCEELSETGILVIQVFSTFHAIETVIDYNPDVILVSMEHSEVQGDEFCSSLRNYKGSPSHITSIPCLMFTSYTDLSRHRLIMNSGADCIISKNFKPGMLAEKIKQVLNYQIDRNNSEVRILFAEDSMTNSKVLEHYAEEMKCAWRSAGNGAEALNAIAEEVFDIIILDIEMPEMDGIEALKEIKRMNPSVSVPIIAYTILNNEKDEMRLLELGFDFILKKPIGKKDFTLMLESCK